MAGGLMQLVAYGAQDVFLTGTPKVTFFQAVYKRHTNFAMETIEQTINGNAGNDGRLSVTIARNGDLVGDMFVELQAKAGLAPVTRGGDATADFDSVWLAERAVKSVEMSIGGQRIDKHYQIWWRLYSELYLNADKKVQWGKMTSIPAASAAGDKVYLPLLFFFNRNAGLYLPLIALQYHEVRLDFDLAADYESYFSTNSPKVWANYIYLDTEERRRFAQKGHEYLIEQVQHTGTDSVTRGSTKQIRLSFNHPVKELVWCFNGGAAKKENTHWNFTSNAVANAVTMSCATDFGDLATANAFVRPEAAGAPHLVTGGVVDTTNHFQLSDNGMWREEGDITGTNSVGPLANFKLVLNGQDRFKEQPGKYFNQVQPNEYHTGCPYPGIYSYSFALKPEEHQPSGTCNFSRIDNAQVAVTMKADAAGNSPETMHLFACNYNVLRIQSGMGGLAFSN